LVNAGEHFDFILPVFDRGTYDASELAAAAGTYFPDPDFLDKTLLEQKCIAAGIPTLPSMPLADLATCTYDTFIIKPTYWSGSKHPNPAVYTIFTKAELGTALAQTATLQADNFFVQKALIDTATQETYLLFVDGTVNGAGVIHFNSIAEKWMLNPDTPNGHITHKTGIRRVSSEDMFGFKEKVTRLLTTNNIRNTPFKAQVIVDVPFNTCYINDWSWGIMPYTHLNVLDPSYVVDHLCFAYDVIPSVTKPIDKAIVMHHIKFPVAAYDYSEVQFDMVFKPAHADVRRAEPIKQDYLNMPRPEQAYFFVLFGVACESVEEGTRLLAEFQSSIPIQ